MAEGVNGLTQLGLEFNGEKLCIGFSFSLLVFQNAMEKWADYVNAVLDKLINWEFALQNAR